MKKVVVFIIAAALIVVLGLSVAGKLVYDKYSYSNEMADLDEFFEIKPGEIAIILQDERIEEKAVLKNSVCYLDMASVHKYLNETFYLDGVENLLLYTDALTTYKVKVGENEYTALGETHNTGYEICYLDGDKLYIALDYVRLFTNFSYELCSDKHMQMYTEWGNASMLTVLKDTAIRRKGGIKSPILRKVKEGEKVEIIEIMETWSKVKTSDAFIGYIENKVMSETPENIIETPVNDYTAPEYESNLLTKKVSLGFHAISGVGGNSTFDSMVEKTLGMNVIAPTWFSICDDNGSLRDFSDSSYVTKAHKKGLKVWAVVDDFNYVNDNKAIIDEAGILASTTKRNTLEKNIVDAAVLAKADGVNLDFENVKRDMGEDYIQFLRELSILCREKGLTLSTDNYVPFDFNDYFRLDIQGEVLDYVLIMGYDEHWHGSKDPGSVASLGYVNNGLEKVLNDVPAEKVINALPLYTIVWKIDGANVSDSYLTLNNTADYIKRMGCELVWDEETSQNYSEWTSGNVIYKVWFEDLTSLQVKLNAMESKGVGGVAVWRLGYDTVGVWNLLNLFTQM